VDRARCIASECRFRYPAPQQRGQQTQQNASNTEFEILPIRNNVYMLAGDGGNIALSIGPDGVLMVDAGTLANSERLLATIQQLQRQLATNGLQSWNFAAETRSNLPRMISPPAPPKPIRYIINTSLDPDHSGGNEKSSQRAPRSPVETLQETSPMQHRARRSLLMKTFSCA